MTGEYKLLGLNKGMKERTFTLIHGKREDIFWATCDWDKERYLALFDLAKNTEDFWKSEWYAQLEFEKKAEDGTPINAKVINVFEK